MGNKILSSSLSAVVLAGLLTGCGADPQTSGNPEQKPNDSTSQNEKPASSNSNSDPNKGTQFEEMKIVFGHVQAGSEDSYLHQGSMKFKELVEKATNGKVTIEIHPAGELGGEREMMEGVQLGTVDMMLASTGPLGNFTPIANAFDFPFLFRDREHAYKVLDGEIGDEIGTELGKSGIQVLAWAENGFRNITNSDRPIKKPEDLNGLKIRTMENKIHMESFLAFGASPTPMAFTELFTSMQQGVVDGQENPLGVIISSKFYEVQKYLSLTGHFYNPALFIITKTKFDSFTPELQRVLLDSAAKARDYQREFINSKEQENLDLVKKEGMEVTAKEDVDYDAFLDASQEVYQKYDNEYGDILRRIQAVK